MNGREMIERIVDEWLFGPGGRKRPEVQGMTVHDGSLQLPDGEIQWNGPRVQFRFYTTDEEPGITRLRHQLVMLCAAAIGEAVAGLERTK